MLCASCGTATDSVTALKKHIRDVHDLREYKCKICDHVVTGKKALSNHVAKHTTRKCTICNQEFPSRTIQHHKKTHLDQEKLKCEICHLFVTTDSSNLKKHMEKCSKPKLSKIYSCQHCKKTIWDEETPRPT